jgi:carbon monoxide dehydrogenase subunit G
MDFTGRYLVPAAPEAVWAGLNNPGVLKICISGCQQMERLDATHFQAAAKWKVGPIKISVKANITLENIDPCRHVTLKGEGLGGIAGFARAEADVMLMPESGGTLVAYTIKASVGGRLAQIGQRLIGGTAKQIADDFFARFTAAIAADGMRHTGEQIL